jgi:hypothetical protein
MTAPTIWWCGKTNKGVIVMKQCVRCSREAKTVVSICDLGYAQFSDVVPLCCICLVKVIRELNKMQHDGELPETTRWRAYKLEVPSA